jgi:hypothetical protein
VHPPFPDDDFRPGIALGILDQAKIGHEKARQDNATGFVVLAVVDMCIDVIERLDGPPQVGNRLIEVVHDIEVRPILQCDFCHARATGR